MRNALINRILSISLIVIGSAGFIFLVGVAAKSEIASEKTFISINSESNVELVLKSIEDNQINDAVTKIKNDILSDENLNPFVKQYFENFITYYNHIKKSGFGRCEINTVYFINNSPYLIDYLRKNNTHNRIEATRLAETIPYFFISLYEQNQKNKTDLYKSYVKIFTENDILSEKTADVLCLYIQSLYKTNVKTDDYLKEEMTIIKKNQEKYKLEIGENGNYEKASIYLANMYKFLFRKVNAKFNWLNFEVSPKYTLSI